MVVNNFKACRNYAICFVAGVTISLFFLWLCEITVVSNPRDIQRNKQCPQCNCESHVKQKITINRDNSKNQVKQQITINRRKHYSCDETFENISNGSVRSTFFVKECANPSENTTTTLILTHPVIENLAFESVTKISLYKFSKVILVAYKSDIALIDNTYWYYRLFNHSFFTVAVDSFGSYGEAMSRALDLVSTPFVLVAPRIAYMNFDIKGQSLDVQRLIRMLETIQEAEIVGGATKDVGTGHWSRGCYQTRDALYTLKFTAGYRHSFHECLFCDHISSPFLARTSFMKNVRFPKDDHGLFLDFFQRVKKTKKLTLSCPDVMFYVNLAPDESDSQLQKFGERWNIGQIIEADGRKKSLLYFRDGPHDKRNKISVEKSCSEQRSEKSLARHPGCRHNLVQFIQYVCKTLSNADIHYEINDGTLLGAVKFDYVLPWEMDADIDVLAPYKEVKNLVPLWRKDGVKIVDHGEAKFNIDLWLYGWKCELYMYSESDLTRYPGLQTSMNIGGEWVYTLENPGYYMRVRYGREIFRHVEHWAHLGKNTGWAPYDAGKFLKCTTPGHQGCLDEFEADGNIQFLDIM